LQRIFAEAGFRRFVAPPLRSYPAIEDYIGFDSDSGRLVHLHLHYELTLGEPHLKGYRLPWEAHVLETRHFDAASGIFVADPAVELVLLLVRRALKQRFRDRARELIAFRGERMRGDFWREFEFLRARVSVEAVLHAGDRLLGAGASEPLRRLLAEPTVRGRQHRFAAAVRRALSRYRTYGPLEATLRRWLREAQWLADGLNRRYFHRATPRRRISPRGGTVIVLLGSDGAGKSTLLKTLSGWLGAKLDVTPIYFGSGDGASAIYRWPLRLAHRLLGLALRPHGALPGARSPAEPREVPPRGQRSAARRARVFWRSPCEKRGKLRRLRRARNRGMIVICDRFPQAETPGFNDGPLLAHWREHKWRVCRSLAAWEGQPHAAAAQTHPDLVIRLIAPPHVAQQRRPEMSLAELARRIQAVQGMKFPATTSVVEIDTDRPLDEIAKAAKSVVWRLL
jgi:thymidylate kinase